MTAPPYAPLLARLRATLEDLVAEVVRDVALPGEDQDQVARMVRPVVLWTLDALSEAEQLPQERIRALRVEGQRAATGGELLQRLLDRYLSTGWVVWGAATRGAGEGDASALPPLGTALLKAGDAAAAAIASGFGEAERAIALRAAGARREFMDELLDLAPGDTEAAVRVRRRATDYGLDPTAIYRLVVATLGREIADGSAELEELAEGIATPERPLPRRAGTARRDSRGEPLVASRRGRVVVLVPTDGPLPSTLGSAFIRLAGDGWLAVASPPAVGLSRLGEAYGTAIDAMAVAARVGRVGLIDADEVLLERALLADESLLAAAVGRELGPILRASRNPRGLLETLEAYIESTQNLRATARRLGIAPRTVAYRLARINALLGQPLRGAGFVRMAAALMAARLLPPHALDLGPSAASRTPRTRRTGPSDAEPRAVPAGTTARVDQPRRAPRDRSRSRPGRGTAT